MHADAIAQVLDDLKPTKYGWRAMLPAEFATFFGVNVAIVFSTRSLPQRSRPPEVSEGEKALAGSILLDLIRVLQEAERNFEIFNIEVPEAMSLVSDPHISIYRSEAKESRPNAWELVVGVKGSPDFGFHVEFEGVEYRGIYAGI